MIPVAHNVVPKEDVSTRCVNARPVTLGMDLIAQYSGAIFEGAIVVSPATATLGRSVPSNP